MTAPSWQMSIGVICGAVVLGVIMFTSEPSKPRSPAPATAGDALHGLASADSDTETLLKAFFGISIARRCNVVTVDQMGDAVEQVFRAGATLGLSPEQMKSLGNRAVTVAKAVDLNPTACSDARALVLRLIG